MPNQKRKGKKGPHLTNGQRGMVAAWLGMKKPYRWIQSRAALSGFTVSLGGITSIQNKLKDTGSVDRRSGSGRKPKLTPTDVRRLKRDALQNRHKSLVQHSREFETRNGDHVSRQTISRNLKAVGLKSCRCAKVPMVSKANKTKRVAWARQHGSDDFSNVIWSDESRYCLVSDRPQKCIRRVGERFRPDSEDGQRKSRYHGLGLFQPKRSGRTASSSSNFSGFEQWRESN